MPAGTPAGASFRVAVPARVPRHTGESAIREYLPFVLVVWPGEAREECRPDQAFGKAVASFAYDYTTEVKSGRSDAACARFRTASRPGRVSASDSVYLQPRILDAPRER